MEVSILVSELHPSKGSSTSQAPSVGLHKPATMSTDGEVANALVCKTSIHGFKSHSVLQSNDMAWMVCAGNAAICEPSRWRRFHSLQTEFFTPNDSAICAESA